MKLFKKKEQAHQRGNNPPRTLERDKEYLFYRFNKFHMNYRSFVELQVAL